MPGAAQATAVNNMNISCEFSLQAGSVFHSGRFAIHIGK